MTTDAARPICRVFKSWPDHRRAICECGWEGYAHVFTFRAKQEARRHCALRRCQLADWLVVHARVE